MEKYILNSKKTATQEGKIASNVTEDPPHWDPSTNHQTSRIKDFTGIQVSDANHQERKSHADFRCIHQTDECHMILEWHLLSSKEKKMLS